MNKCDCPNCMNAEMLRHFAKGTSAEAWDGKGTAAIMIGAVDGMPVHVGTIQIDSIPLLVEPWMIQKVLMNATKELTKYVVNNSNGKVEN